MSNKTQLQTNNIALDGYIVRINAAKEVAAGLPEAGGGGGGSVETCTVMLMSAMYRYYCTVYQDGVIASVTGSGGQPTIANVVCGSVMTIEGMTSIITTFNGCTKLGEYYDESLSNYVYAVRIDAPAGGQVTIAP